MTLGEKIKKLRKERKITQKQIANLLGKSERMVQKYESGEVTPSIEVLLEICKILDVPSFNFFDSEDSENDSDRSFEEFASITGTQIVQDAEAGKKNYVMPFINYVNDKYFDSKYNVEKLLKTNTDEILNHTGNYDDLLYLLIDIIRIRLKRYDARDKYE